MTARALLLLLFMVLTAAPAAFAQDRPFPAGESTHELEGLTTTIVMPREFDPAKERSMVVILHGYGGTAVGMAHAMTFVVETLDCVVVAPKSTGDGWSESDVAAVRRLVAPLRKQLNIGTDRLHGVGFSNGGWNLAKMAFDPDLRFTSACWVAAGYNGGSAPKHAKKGMGALALAGSEDANRKAAEATVPALEDKMRSVEVRIQPGLGHKWPGELMPYFGWWLGLQEGRFVPGETLAFPWAEPDELPQLMDAGTGSKAGAFLYWYATDDAQNEQAKALQNKAFQDLRVRFFGEQLAAYKLDRAEHEELFTRLKLKTTPAIVVLDRRGKPKKTLAGKIKAKSLAGALRAVAPKKKPD